MKAVHFGAGNIGRGFIGLLLAASGYTVTFVDVDLQRIALLNELGSYPVRIVGREGETIEWVHGVDALHLNDREAVIRAVAEADMVTTAVGKSVLPALAPVIAQGLLRRSHDQLPVLVIACENALGNSQELAWHVSASADEDAPSALAAGMFPDCVVDRIVPNLFAFDGGAPRHPLEVTVEDYAQWVVDATNLARCPTIAGLEYREGLAAVLAQKLFTLNMGHAVLAYEGQRAGHRYVHEAAQDERLLELLRGAMFEAGRAIVSEHGIAVADQAAYAERVIARFQNAALRDDIARVGRQPMRKLGPNDRLVQPALGVVRLGDVPAFLSAGIAAALSFDADEGEARQLQTMVREHGVRQAFAQVSGLDPTHPIVQIVHATYAYHGLGRG